MFQPPDVPMEGGPRAGKVVRKNTKGEKIAAGCTPVGPIAETETQMPELVAPNLSQNLVESRSAEIRKIQSMTEADICNYVKTMAPQLQDNAWEEIVKETNFQERLDKARMKMQEHAQEMGRIRREVETGRIDAKTGNDLMRKVYNRREAAASRTKREQGLVKAAVKVRVITQLAKDTPCLYRSGRWRRFAVGCVSICLVVLSCLARIQWIRMFAVVAVTAQHLVFDLIRGGKNVKNMHCT